MTTQTENAIASYSELHEPGLAITPHSVYQTSGWKWFAVMLLLTVIVTGGIGYSAFHKPPKLSPLTEVEFKGDQVFVVYQGKKPSAVPARIIKR